MSEIKTNIFLKTALAQIPRLLGQLNRQPLSLSYGSFDRAFWHYRTNDISCARYQEAVLTLALLYTYDFAGNIYYHNKKILDWINGSLKFTLSIQNSDGSFNEWYLNERSFVATAFLSAALVETVETLGKDNIKEYNKLLACLTKAAGWLSSRSEELVFNQLAGSALALAKISRLTGDESFASAAKTKLSIIKKSQSAEGWWSEYGGPDIGYLSLMVDYLTKYYQLELSEEALAMTLAAGAFIVNFLQPNLTAAGEYMSRNTEYLIPSGFAYLSELDENAKIITAFNQAALARGAGLGPANLDDRYLCYILYNWLEAGLSLLKQNDGDTVDIYDYLKNRRLDKFFEKSGLRIKQTDKYYFVSNLYKGGVFRLYARGQEYLDSGIEIKGSKRLIANALDYGNKIKNESDRLEIHGALKPVKETLMKTPLMLLFKTWQLLFGRLAWTEVLLKNFLRKKMIIYKDSAGISFKREFIFNEQSLVVNDEVGAPVLEKDFYVGRKTSYNFIPSAKYFTSQEISGSDGLVKTEYFSDKISSSCRRVFYFN